MISSFLACLFRVRLYPLTYMYAFPPTFPPPPRWTGRNPAELHDKRHQPDLENGRQMGMPLDEFTTEAWEALVQGKEDVPVGMGKEVWEAFEPERRRQGGGFLRG